MKTSEQKYDESYDKQGCLAFMFAALIVMLILSVVLNVILYIKINEDAKATIETPAMDNSQAGCRKSAHGGKEKSGILSYIEMEKGEPGVQKREPAMQALRSKRFYSSFGGYRSQSTASVMRGSLGPGKLGGTL